MSNALARSDGAATAVRIGIGVGLTAATAVSAYHGYRRNRSIGWALVWGAMGFLFPVMTPTIALAQGFGQPATEAR